MVTLFWFSSFVITAKENQQYHLACHVISQVKSLWKHHHCHPQAWSDDCQKGNYHCRYHHDNANHHHKKSSLQLSSTPSSLSWSWWQWPGGSGLSSTSLPWAQNSATRSLKQKNRTITPLFVLCGNQVLILNYGFERNWTISSAFGLSRTQTSSLLSPPMLGSMTGALHWGPSDCGVEADPVFRSRVCWERA